jgi:hypothetical protein
MQEGPGARGGDARGGGGCEKVLTGAAVGRGEPRAKRRREPQTRRIDLYRIEHCKRELRGTIARAESATYRDVVQRRCREAYGLNLAMFFLGVIEEPEWRANCDAINAVEDRCTQAAIDAIKAASTEAR